MCSPPFSPKHYHITDTQEPLYLQPSSNDFTTPLELHSFAFFCYSIFESWFDVAQIKLIQATKDSYV